MNIHFLTIFVTLGALGSCYVADAAEPAPVPTGASSSPNKPSRYDDEAQPYAKIDWTIPLDPSYVPLGGGGFLVETKQGVQHWDALRNVFSAPRDWPGHPSVVYGVFARLAGEARGTLFFVRSKHNYNEVDSRPTALLWWSTGAQAVTASMALPPGFRRPRLLALREGRVLVCGATGSFVVRVRETSIERETAAMNESARSWMQSAGVIGPVEGYEELDSTRDEASHVHPLLFDTRMCRYRVTNPPEPMQPEPDLTVQPYRLRDGRVLIGHAEWLNPAARSYDRLDTPLVWNDKAERWEHLERVARHGGALHATASFAPDDPVVNMSSPSPEWIEFLDPHTLRWRRSRQRLTHGAHSVAPLDESSALVFMNDFGRPAGHVMKLQPMIDPLPIGQLNFPHDTVSEVPLRGEGLMLVGGGDEWYPLNRPEVVRPNFPATLIRPLPVALVNPSGAELKDGSVLVFGGLRAGCGPHHGGKCSDAPPLSSYRWIPANDRWEEVPDLRIPFANGAYWPGNASDIARQWGRSDAVVRANGDFVYIDAGTPRSHDWTYARPSTSTLFRWRPGAAPAAVAALGHARELATLIELDDRRLAVIGGNAQGERLTREKLCFDCPETVTSLGPFERTRTTEIFDNKTRRWRSGPHANYAGGRAVKLASGRIFKLSPKSYEGRDGHEAETADARLKAWTKAPPLPVRGTVRMAVGVGNRVLVVMNEPQEQAVIWDDIARRWSVVTAWPRAEPVKAEPLLSVTPVDRDRVLLRYGTRYEYATLPR